MISGVGIVLYGVGSDRMWACMIFLIDRFLMIGWYVKVKVKFCFVFVFLFLTFFCMWWRTIVRRFLSWTGEYMFLRKVCRSICLSVGGVLVRVRLYGPLADARLVNCRFLQARTDVICCRDFRENLLIWSCRVGLSIFHSKFSIRRMKRWEIYILGSELAYAVGFWNMKWGNLIVW